MSVKSELEKTASYLRRARQSIIGRGGEISLTAGLKDLPEAIFNIPADASLAHYTDNGIAYRKSVPVGAEKYALLKSIGGMTYKSNNLLPYPYYIMGDKGNIMNGTTNGVNFSITEDGAISVNSTSNSSDVTNIVLINSSAPITFEAGTYTFRQYRSNNDANAYIVWAAREEDASTQYLYEDVVKTFSKPFTLWCAIQIKGKATVNATFKPMFYKGTAELPYERYYEGLRDSKVTEIVSKGANLFPILPWANRTISGVTFRLDENGVYHLSGTATTTLSAALKVNLPVGKYTLSVNYNKQIGSGFANAVYVTARSADMDWKITHSTHQPHAYTTLTTTVDIVDVMLAIMEGVNCDGLTIAPMINRGDYIPYTPYREPISKPIPKALQDIDGWGKGLRSASGNLTTQRDFYNICDFSTKQYTQWVSETITIDGENVKAVELGSATGEIRIDLRTQTSQYADYTALQLTRFTPSLSKTPNTAYLVAEGVKLILNLFTTETFTTVEEANEWLKANPIEVIYAFKEPIITDISDILTDDNFIEVESGGSLEFVNEYKYAVPSTVKYTVKVGS